MYQDITIVKIDTKITKTQKPYKSCLVKDPNGAEFKVNIWSDFPNFANLAEGSIVKAKLEQNGQYWTIISETQDKPRGGGNSGFKTAQIEKTMERKEQS